MYKVITKSGREMGQFDSKTRAVLYMHELESQDMDAGVYSHGAYQVINND